jgi:hypothetical protein
MRRKTPLCDEQNFMRQVCNLMSLAGYKLGSFPGTNGWNNMTIVADKI